MESRFGQITRDAQALLSERRKEQFDHKISENFERIEALASKALQREREKRQRSLNAMFSGAEPIPEDRLLARLPSSFEQPGNARFTSMAVVGIPNAGKSTLLNQLLKTKATPVSPKAQTTRSQLACIWTREHVQIAFQDTPGVPRHDLARSISPSVANAAWSALGDANSGSSDLLMPVVLFVIDAASKAFDEEDRLLERIHRAHPDKALAIVLNKTDLSSFERCRLIEAKLRGRFPWIQGLFHVSAKSGCGVSELENFLLSGAPLAAWQYPPMTGTLQSDVEKMEECMREKIFLRFHQEIPYSVKVSISALKETERALFARFLISCPTDRIAATIVGKGGESAAFLIDQSKQELERLYRKKILIRLDVKNVGR